MQLRLGLVGRGRWGRNIERTLQALPDIAVSVIPKDAQPATRLDGVLIATQSATHARIALPYIEAGLPTFIEKPMATTAADAELIRDAAARSGALVFVGHIYLFHPAFLAALALLPSLGAVRYLLAEGMNDRPRTDSSVLWDWLPHDLSMARAILGREPRRVTGWRLSGDAVLSAAVTQFAFDDVALVSTVSWLSHVRRRRIVIGCAEGTVVFDDIAERRVALHRPGAEPCYPDYSDEPPLTCELRAFVAAIRAGRRDDAHLAAGLSIVRAIAAAEQAIAGRSSVEI